MRKRRDLPSVEYLYECFTPDFENGTLIWNTRPHHHFTNKIYCEAFNKKYGLKSAGSLAASGYCIVVISGACYFIHRVLWKMFYREEPPLIIDHIDEIRTNNKISNLQKSDRKTNKIKSSKVLNASGFRGVYKRKDRNSYEVRISLHGSNQTKIKDIHVGYYVDILEAAAAYNLAVKCLGYADNYLNEVVFDEQKINTNKKFFKEVGYHSH